MDNQSAIAISYNPELHSRTKHVDRRHFFIRECVENHLIRVPFVKTVDNLADFFTKPLPSKVFFAMRDQIMNVPSASESSEELVDAEDKYEAAMIMSGAERSPPRASVARSAATSRRVTFAASVDLELCRCVCRHRRCHRGRANAYVPPHA